MSRITFQKRQKEMKRQEKQQRKAERRAERKLAKNAEDKGASQSGESAALPEQDQVTDASSQ